MNYSKKSNSCKECIWHGLQLDCPANYDVDTKECKNFEPKEKKKEGEQK